MLFMLACSLVLVTAAAASGATAVTGGEVELVLQRPEGVAGEAVQTLELPGEAIPALLKRHQQEDRRVLRTHLAGPPLAPAAAVYIPNKDLAAVADAPVLLPRPGSPELTVVFGEHEQVRLKLAPHYYRDVLGIDWYAPRRPRPGWPSPPAVAMTWYGIQGWEGSPAQTKEWLHPQIDWVAEHLLPYAGHLVFQLDDNYPYEDDAYMRGLSDYIRARGLTPGIWFPPYGVAEPETAEAHPEWFLQDADGHLLTAFAGVNWRDARRQDSDNFVLNVTNEEAMEQVFAPFWRKASETWNFDFFKIDGQPTVINRYRASVNGGGVAGYRRGLERARQIVGERKFINGCYGIPLGAMGLLDGSRTGPDSGLWPHAYEIVAKWNFLNNIAWWCDPDAAAHQHRMALSTVRLNAVIRALTGQQFLTDDIWTETPPDVLRVWRQCLPVSDILPMNLYPIGAEWTGYDHMALHIGGKQPAIVAALLNFQGESREKVLDLGRIAPPWEKVRVYDFFRQHHLGAHPNDARIPVSLDGHGAALFALVPADAPGPALLAIDRHLSQAARAAWSLSEEDTGRVRMRGEVPNLVAGSPVELVFVAGALSDVTASSTAGDAQVRFVGDTARVTVTPETSGTGAFEVVFAPRVAPLFSVWPETRIVATPDAGGVVELVNLGGTPCRWTAAATSGRVALRPDAGELAPQDRATVQVLVDTDGLMPGRTCAGDISFALADAEKKHVLPVLAEVPPPPNLARDAEAAASSAWSSVYIAMRVNDGSAETRWNSSEKEQQSAWVQLEWDTPVTFNRVVLDECTDFGLRVQEWRLEADGETIARGSALGRKHVCALKNEVTAKTLRLVIEAASAAPTIWEMEVYDWPEEGGGGRP